MAEDFRIKIGSEFNSTNLENQVNNVIRQLEQKCKIKIETSFDTSSLKNYEQQLAGLTSKEIKEQAKLSNAKAQYIKEQTKLEQQQFNARKVQMNEELKMERQRQKLANEANSSTYLNLQKNAFDSKLSAYLKENTKLTENFKLEIAELRAKLQDADNVEFKNLKVQFTDLTNQAKAAGVTGRSWVDELKNDARKITEWLLSTTAVMGAVNTLKQMVTEVTNIDTAFVSLKKVTDETNESYNNFLDNAIVKAQNLGSTVSDLVEMTATWAKLGYSLEEASELAEVSSVFANVAEISNTDEAVSDLVTAMKAYKLEASEAMDIADKLNSLSNKYAVDAAGLGTALQESASVMAMSGTSLDKTLSMLTAMTEITQDASRSGTALKILGLRLRGASADLESMGESTDGLCESTSLLREKILALSGVDIMEDDDTFRDVYDIMLDISKVYDDLTDVSRASLLETIAGKNRSNDVASLLTNMSQAENALATSMDSAGSAMREQEAWLDSIEAKIKQFQAAFQGLSATVVDSDLVKFIVDFGTKAVSALDWVIGKMSALSVAGGILTGVLGAKFATSLGAAIPLLGKLATIITTATGASIGLSTALSTAVPVMAIITGITFVIKAFDRFNESYEETIDRMRDSASEYEEATQEIASVETELESCRNKIKEINSLGGAEFAKEGELEALQEQEEQLQRNLDIEKERQRVAKENAEDAAVDALGNRTKSNYQDVTIYDANGVRQEFGSKTTEMEELIKVSMWYANLSQQLEELKDKKAELARQNLGNTDEYKTLSSDIEELESSMKNARDDASDLAVSINEQISNIDGVTDSGKEMLSMYDTAYGYYDRLILKTDEATGSLDDLSEAQERVVETVPTESGLTFTEDQTKAMSDYQSALKSIKSAYEDLENVDVVSLMSEFPTYDWSGFVNGAKDIKTVLQELADSAENTANSSVAGLEEEFGKLKDEALGLGEQLLDVSDAMEALEKNSKVLYDANEELQNGAFSVSTLNDMVNAYDEMSDGVAQYTAGLISEAELFDMLSQCYETDQANYEAAIRAKMEATPELYQMIVSSEGEKISKLAEAYGLDYDNWVTVEQAKQEAEAKLISNLTKMWGDYLSIVIDDLGYATTAYRQLSYDEEISGANEEWAKNEVEFNKITEKYVQDYNELNSLLTRDFDFGSIDTSWNTLGNTSSGSNGKKKSSGSKSGSEEKTKDYSESIDMAEQSIKQLENAVDSLNSKLDNTKGYDEQLSALDELIKAQEDLKAGYEESAKVYSEEYEKVMAKLPNSDEFRKMIENGQTFDIIDFIDKGVKSGETGVNQQIKELVDEAIDWYNKSQESSKNAIEIGYAIDENLDKKIETKLERAETKLATWEEKYDNATTAKRKNEILEKEKATEWYILQYNLKLADSEEERNKLLAERKNRLEEIADLEYENVKSERDSKVNFYDSRISDLQNAITLSNTQGKDTTREQYESLNTLYDKEKAVLDAELKSAIERRNSVEWGTKKYDEYNQEVQYLQDKINECTVAQIENNKAIASIPLDALQKETDALNKQLDILNEKKALVESSISAASSIIQDEIDSYNDEIEAIEDRYSTEIDLIQEKIDALKETNDENEREIALQKARYAMEQAQNQKTNAVIRNGELVYEADQSAIRDAQQSIDEAEYNIMIADLEDQVEALEKARDAETKGIQESIDSLQEYKSSIDSIADDWQRIYDTQTLISQFGADIMDKLISGDLSAIEMLRTSYDGTASSIKALEQEIQNNEDLLNTAQDFIDAWDGASETLPSVLDEIGQKISENEAINEAIYEKDKQVGDYVSEWDSANTSISEYLGLMSQSLVESVQNDATAWESRYEQVLEYVEKSKRQLNSLLSLISSVESSISSSSSSAKEISVSKIGKSHSGIAQGYIRKNMPDGYNGTSVRDDYQLVSMQKLKPDEILRVLQVDEAVITPAQRKTTLDNLQGAFNAGLSYSAPNYSRVNNNTTNNSPVNVTFTGDINLPSVKNMDEFTTEMCSGYFGAMLGQKIESNR
ncbi:MAG: phage tail tape measure protein [Erysipelotrichaceae bacterium]|nr:phage tail tape measure protein [Erysipelotrichaceae bacterium]